MAQFSYVLSQTVETDGNLIFSNGDRACKKHLIDHRDDSGIFTLKGCSGGCRALYAVTFTGNIAISATGTVSPISVAITYNGEALRNATAIVTPAAIGDFFNVSITTFVEVPCGCCVSVGVENVSATTAIEVTNANIIFERIA